MEKQVIPIEYGLATLIGVGRERPVKLGNCFALLLPNDASLPILRRQMYHVANMYCENLKYWQEETGAKDVEIAVIDSAHVVLITDKRIPENYKKRTLCRTCLGERAVELQHFLDEYIDDKIDEWHDGGSRMPLFDYLGMTEEDYKKFVEGFND